MLKRKHDTSFFYIFFAFYTDVRTANRILNTRNPLAKSPLQQDICEIFVAASVHEGKLPASSVAGNETWVANTFPGEITIVGLCLPQRGVRRGSHDPCDYSPLRPRLLTLPGEMVKGARLSAALCKEPPARLAVSTRPLPRASDANGGKADYSQEVICCGF